jgi:hypothetical protein
MLDTARSTCQTLQYSRNPSIQNHSQQASGKRRASRDIPRRRRGGGCVASFVEVAISIVEIVQVEGGVVFPRL